MKKTDAADGKKKSLRKELANIRKLLGDKSLDSVRQGIALARGLNEKEIWVTLLKGLEVNEAGVIEIGEESEVKRRVKASLREDVAVELFVAGAEWVEGRERIVRLDLDRCTSLVGLEGIGGLTSLTSLNLGRCRSLVGLEGIGGLTSLTSLNLGRCTSLVGTEGMGELKLLTSLNLSDCTSLVNIPGIGGLTSLASLDLSGCTSLIGMEGMGGLVSLTSLDLSGCTSLVGMEGMEGLKSLTSLNLRECTSLVGMKGMEGLTSLKLLDLSGCTSFVDVEGIGGLTSLAVLDLRGCRGIADVDKRAEEWMERAPSLRFVECEVAGESRVIRRRAERELMVAVVGGRLPQGSKLAGMEVGPFKIGRYAVRWKEWKEVREWGVGKGYDLGGVGTGRGEEHPVTGVSWYAVVKWCNALSEKEGLVPVYEVKGEVYRSGDFGDEVSEAVVIRGGADGYRLPLEAEWEWAARGGIESKGYRYSGGDDLMEVGWYIESASGHSDGHGTATVGGKAGNELGLYDMSGNVREWCFERFDASDSARVVRGGGWDLGADGCAVGYRNRNYPSLSCNSFGFRLALSSIPRGLCGSPIADFGERRTYRGGQGKKSQTDR